ncbi:MAG: adenosylcobinamide-GDP ribazoletransferase [Methanomassiliicoccaceae archaeon]|nr:adenosylcobinamide-GDP ribazoletransferase [Methanomassiliicoccaceae archaeon]
MPDETNDLLGNEGASANVSNQQKDGSEDQKKTNGQGMDGQVSAQGADNTAQPEEEPVGSKRPEPRPVRKMNAADFKVKSEPKQQSIPSAQDPARQEAAQQKPEQQKPAPQPAPAQPRPEPKPEPAASRPAPQPTPVQPKQEPKPEPVVSRQAPQPEPEPVEVHSWEPVREEPPVAETEYRWKEPEEPDHKKMDVSPGGFIDAIKGAFSFFTIFPINVGEKEIQALNKNFYVVPFAGFLIGLIATIIGMILFEARAGTLVAISVLATTYIISKFLHFDGLVDFGDGMMSSKDREGSIRALKDTKIGAGGFGIALILVIATIFALNGIWHAFLFAAVIIITEVFVKNAMVATAAFGEPGTGMASEQVGNTGLNTLLISTGISAALAFAGYLIMGLVESNLSVPGMWTSVPMISAVLLIAGAAASSILIGWLLAYLSNKKFGFVNGDVLGASNEISRLLILFVAIIIVAFYTLPNF